MFGKLTYLKSLELDDCSLMFEPDFLMNIQEIIPSLDTLTMTTGSDHYFPMDIDCLVEVLESIGNIKNLYFKDLNGYGKKSTLSLCLLSDLPACTIRRNPF